MTAEAIVDQTTETLIFYLLEWLDVRDRTCEEVMEVWCTSCPRHPVWEEANRRGFVTGTASNAGELIHLTLAGAAVLRKHHFLEIMRNYLKVVR